MEQSKIIDKLETYQSPRRRADGTLPRQSAGSEFEGRHRAERVQELGGAVLSVLDRSDREDVRVHQPRCNNASAFGLRGYVDTLSLSLLCITMILRVRRKFFEITTLPNNLLFREW